MNGAMSQDSGQQPRSSKIIKDGFCLGLPSMNGGWDKIPATV